MDLIKINTYQNKLFTFIDKYEKWTLAFIGVYVRVLWGLLSIIKYIVYGIADVTAVFSKIMRYATFPFHWWDIRWEIKHTMKGVEVLPIFKTGAHYWYGKPGTGKSTSVYHAIMEHSYHTGNRAYTTAYMETPRTDLSGREYFYHQYFEPSMFYQNGEQIAGFDYGYDKIVYEEMLTNYHQRNNKERAYNDEVLPMITSMGTQRHQNIELFYFISQLPKNDISIMQMLVGYHKPKIKKGFDYILWLNTGKLKWVVKGWKIKSYDIEVKSSYDFELVNKKTYFYKNTLPEDFKYFNRLNMKKHFEQLPRAKGVPMVI